MAPDLTDAHDRTVMVRTADPTVDIAPPGANLRRPRGLFSQPRWAIRGNGVGVDVSEAAVLFCREKGFEAYSKSEFDASGIASRHTFDSVLIAHVLEHMTRLEAVALLDEYRELMRAGGKVVLICPQERGYASDETHVNFQDSRDLIDIAHEAGLVVERAYSFPFPRRFGKLFVYNESVVVARTSPSASSSG